ncbi:uncharacterized protein LOC133033014 isoform X3 [Cannabis sativa]|uniref:uncharacterized protein LOC133033014 isoform X3 n=1 Tax=Cannabis sativa TaxID=3483 RepID=UPI0029C9BF01|nr:uncharacterized protein LOC133033014 isoform X3 [Cannabis sativa]
MMGFGPYGGNGGSYLSPSSSSLSASAPPFTIDRSGPKPTSCPLMDLAESSYPGAVNSSMHNWLPSLAPTSEPHFFPSTQLEHNSGPSSNAYGYGGSPPVESSNLSTHLPHLSTTVSASVDGFSYGQPSDSAGATGFVEAKPYYPSFFSSSGHKDSGLRNPDQTSYDWLSTSSRVPSALVGYSNSDQPVKFLDSSYAGQWGDMWNGFAEWKQGKQGQLNGSLGGSKETGVPVPSMYENYMNQESHNPKVLNRSEEVSRGTNFQAPETHSGYMNLDMMLNLSSTGKTSDFMPMDHSKPILGSFSGLQETHPESTSFIFGTNSGNHQIPYGGSNEKRLKQKVNSSASTVKSSPVLVMGTPTNNIPFKTMNLGSNTTHAVVSSKKACDINDPHSQLSFGGNLCFDSSRFDDPITSRSFFSKKDETLNKECITNDPSCQMLKVKSGVQTSNVSHDGFNLDLNANESINSVADSSESVEHFYPPVDSPCWKGVARSSPFVASEDVTEMRKPEKQTFPLNTCDKVSPEKAVENIKYHQFGCLENSSEIPLNLSSAINSETRERQSDDVANTNYCSETKVIKHSDDNNEHGRSMGFPDSKTFQASKQDFQGDGLTSENNNETVQFDSSSLRFPVEHVSSPSDKDASSKLTKSNEGQSTPTVDVLMLVNTISNLSELLVSHCTSGLYNLKQKDLESVQSAINNLNVCVSNNSEKMIPTQEPTSSEKDTSDYPREQNDIHKGVTEDSPKLTKTIMLKNLFDCQNFNKGKSNFLSNQKDDEMFDSASVKDDLDIEDEDKATQALKKVLAENFPVEDDETEPQTVLYKNLWLEAEAALCSLNYKARYNRMKMEMEKHKLPNSIDAGENTTAATDVKKPSSSEACPDQNAVESPKAEGSPAARSHSSPVLSSDIQADDVLARFHLLKCRHENSNSDTVANVDKPSSSQLSSESTNAVKILADTHEENVGSRNPENLSLLASTMRDTLNPTNKFEASVLARFHILKSRVNNHKEASQSPDIVNLGFSSENREWPYIGQEARNSDVQPKASLQHHAADSTEGQLIGSDFDMLVNDDSSTQSDHTNSNRVQNENLLFAGWLDRVSSDWEHVRKEEFGLQVGPVPATTAGDYYE